MAIDSTILGDKFLGLPSGTTAERVASPSNGFTRFNTTLGVVETYHGATDGWVALSNNFQATGGTETTSGGYRIHTFTSSGNFVVQSGSKTVDYLIVAGGGGGGSDVDIGGAGGAGGMLVGSANIGVQTYAIVVGAGGSRGTGGDSQGGLGTPGTAGGNSSFNGLTAIGGGQGAPRDTAGFSGGSGGGGGDGPGSIYGTGAPGNPGGAGTSGQGNPGGTSWSFNWQGRAKDSGAGGGKGSAADRENPGAGLSNSYSGTAVTYATGGTPSQSGAQDPTANTGNGGWGCREGASGIVIIRYLI